LTASAFNRLVQYTSSPAKRAYCYAELAVSSTAMVVTIASILITPTREGMARLSVHDYIHILVINLHVCDHYNITFIPSNIVYYTVLF